MSFLFTRLQLNTSRVFKSENDHPSTTAHIQTYFYVSRRLIQLDFEIYASYHTMQRLLGSVAENLFTLFGRV